jgi:hypothetical protein
VKRQGKVCAIYADPIFAYWQSYPAISLALRNQRGAKLLRRSVVLLLEKRSDHTVHGTSVELGHSYALDRGSESRIGECHEWLVCGRTLQLSYTALREDESE